MPLKILISRSPPIQYAPIALADIKMLHVPQNGSITKCPERSFAKLHIKNARLLSIEVGPRNCRYGKLNCYMNRLRGIIFDVFGNLRPIMYLVGFET